MSDIDYKQIAYDLRTQIYAICKIYGTIKVRTVPVNGNGRRLNETPEEMQLGLAIINAERATRVLK